MDPFEGYPHSFPRASGSSDGPWLTRGPRRHSRPPAFVRISLTPFQRPATTTTTNTHGSLLPITRFSRPQDATTANEHIINTRSSRDVLLFLQNVSNNPSEQLVWDICLKLYELLKNHNLPFPPLLRKVLLSRQSPDSLTELLVYNPASRYQEDFEEKEELGRGGFGRVVRARKKLDGLHYAIKMIIAKEDLGESSLDDCVSEVRTLAQLEHPRVVRYFGAWVQQEVWTHQSHWTSATVRELSSATDDDSEEGSSSDDSMSPQSPEASPGDTTPSDESVVFQDTEPGKAEAHLPSPGTQAIQQPPGHTPSQGSVRGMGRGRGRGVSSGAVLPYSGQVSPRVRKVLYIQMRLYGVSLRKWMDDRNNTHSPRVVERECLRILYQVVEAVCYIHQQGYMHRDIKPANILFTVDGSDVHLGDFGLARLITHPSTASTHTRPLPHRYTQNVGTPLYTAPEVKQGNYREKSDMYCLGIILLELFMPFKTNSERGIVITKVKTSGQLDPELINNWPTITYWIKKLIDKDPANRPSAKQLLESSLFVCTPPTPTSTPTPSPSPNAASGVTDAGGCSMVEAVSTTTTTTTATVQSSCSQYRSVNTIEINGNNGNTFYSNSSVRIEDHSSKDEQIAALIEENTALKREMEALRRNLERCKSNNDQQAQQN